MNRRNLFRNALAVAGTALCAAWAGGFFPSREAAAGVVIRPPGALDEEEFLSRCIRCMRCADACPNNAIVPMDAARGRRRESTPAIQPRRQACMLCNGTEGGTLKCTEACPSGALQLIRRDPDEIRARVAMGVATLDRALCYSYNSWSCGACYRACPLPGKAMTLGLWERPTVHPEDCIGCGLCERACIRYPQAIRVGARRS